MVTELERPYLRPTINVLNSAHILLLLHPPNCPVEPLHNLAPIPQVVLRSSGGGGGDPLPPPPAGLGYYTRSQAADVFLRFHGDSGGRDIDWQAWEERLEACPLGECPESIRPPRLCSSACCSRRLESLLAAIAVGAGFSPQAGLRVDPAGSGDGDISRPERGSRRHPPLPCPLIHQGYIQKSLGTIFPHCSPTPLVRLKGEFIVFFHCH